MHILCLLLWFPVPNIQFMRSTPADGKEKIKEKVHFFIRFFVLTLPFRESRVLV